MTPARRLAARLDAAYGRSGPGRRLERRLRLGLIDTTPARWRLGQALLMAPLALLAYAMLGLAGVALAAGAVRVGGGTLLRAGARRRLAALERGGPLLARRLAAELAAGAGAEDALAAATASLPASERALRPLAREAVVRGTLGESPGAALAAAATCAGVEDRGLHAVAALLALQGCAGGDPDSFERLAAALEAATATRDDARALTAEARLAAAGVPALAGVLGVTLILTQPSIGAGVLAPLAAAALGGCAVVALSGTLLARRLAGDRAVRGPGAAAAALPIALELVAAALRAGVPLQRALAVAGECTDPALGPTIAGLVERRRRLGLPLAPTLIASSTALRAQARAECLARAARRGPLASVVTATVVAPACALALLCAVLAGLLRGGHLLGPG